MNEHTHIRSTKGNGASAALILGALQLTDARTNSVVVAGPFQRNALNIAAVGKRRALPSIRGDRVLNPSATAQEPRSGLTSHNLARHANLALAKL